ncbi:MAG: hypothetical protein DLM72_13875 [Candidatus Nitrosopolaris wilkensis]|nr:MAG: hypothetical protein DLM72_13875 [Candidatus Nitrosopolaris wilkensis]
MTTMIHEFPLNDEIRELGFSKVCANGKTLLVYNSSDLPPIQCEYYKNDLQATINDLRQALIESGHFDNKTIEKFLVLLSQVWVKSVEEEQHSRDEEESSLSQAERIVQIAEGKCQEFFVDQYRTPYSAVNIGGHTETLPLNNGGRFKHWLSKTYYELEEKVPNAESISNALNVLKAKADFDGNSKEMNLRVASYNNKNEIYYDLTNGEWEAVKITSEGWSIEKAPVIFKRYSNQQPQVYPSEQYPDDVLDKFMQLLNVSGDNVEDHKLLLTCWIVAAFFPDIPIPVLMLPGEQGGGKSTLQELVKMLVDPSSIRTLIFPKDIDALIQQLAHNYIGFYDNISRIPDWISDQLCRAVTGSGFSKRRLYTDDDDVIYFFKSRLGFNGINMAATKADLLDRGLIIELKRIDKKEQREVTDIWNKFEEIRPKLLGYILDIVVKVLGIIQAISVKLEELPRMADFAKIGEIISRCMGNPDNLFLQAYYKNITLQTEALLESSHVATAIVKFMADKEIWKGSATDLLERLVDVAESLSISTMSKLWPKSPNILSRKLNEVRTNLRDIGINIERQKDSNTTRIIEITKIESNKTEKTSSQSSQSQIDAPLEPAIRDDIEDDNDCTDDKPCKKNTQNHAQNQLSDDIDGKDDIIPTVREELLEIPWENQDSIDHNTNASFDCWHGDPPKPKPLDFNDQSWWQIKKGENKR